MHIRIKRHHFFYIYHILCISVLASVVRYSVRDGRLVAVRHKTGENHQQSRAEADGDFTAAAGASVAVDGHTRDPHAHPALPGTSRGSPRQNPVSYERGAAGVEDVARLPSGGRRAGGSNTDCDSLSRLKEPLPTWE